jgi:tripartite-type tricarboxylate transporter receptor subunit TctC
MLTRRRLLATCATSAFGLSVGDGAAHAQTQAHAQSQAWPNRVVRFIVPFAAGGPTDFVCRIVAEQLSRIWNQQVVIENRGGNSLPATSVQEFVAFAKANRGKVTLASPGTGSTPHLAGELLKRLAGIEMTHVPYRGASPALNDLIPGRVHAYFGSGALLGNMRSGQVRGLAATGAKRDPAAPELPTIAEAGIPGYEVSSWHGLFVPAKTPPQVIKKMNADTTAALADPVIKAGLEQAGYMVVGSSPEDLAVLLRSEIDKWSIVIRDAGIGE